MSGELAQPEPRQRSKCDCFECSVYCRCSCHPENVDIEKEIGAVQEKVMTAFDTVFDLVHFIQFVPRKEVHELCLTEKGVIQMAKYFEKRSYYPNNDGIEFDPIRGSSQ